MHDGGRKLQQRRPRRVDVDDTDGSLVGDHHDETPPGCRDDVCGAWAVVNRFWVNGRGWRTKSTSTIGTGAAKTWSSTYGRVGQKLTETGLQGTISHSYGLAGEQLTVDYPDGAATSSYLHDPAGRLTEVSVSSGGITVPYATYTYDDGGRQTSELIHAAGGATRTWAYDGAGRLTALTEVLPNTTTTWETYTAALTYRADGRLATETVNSGPTAAYGYDNAGQLTSAADGTGGAPDRSWTYGTRGNRLTAVEDGVTTTYTTNPNASVAKTTRGTDTVTYAYDDAGRRASETRKTGTTTTGTTTVTPSTEGYAGYIVTVNTGTQTKAEARAYDPDGKLIMSDTGGGTTVTRHYQWDTTQPIPQILEARNSGSIWFRTAWGNQRIAYKEGTAAPQWFQYDARGSVIRTDPANTNVVVGPQQYDPFGGYAGQTGADRIGYRGELTASNLIYLRARNYDPGTGQFTSRDRLDGVDGSPVVANGAVYADGDPINNFDPLGLQTIDAAFNIQEQWQLVATLLEACQGQDHSQHTTDGVLPLYTCGQFLIDIGETTPAEMLVAIIAEVTGARAMYDCTRDQGITRTCISAMSQILLFASLGASGAETSVALSDDLVHGSTALRPLENASEVAFKVADDGNYIIKPKHLFGAGGNYNKFASGVDAKTIVAEALRSEGAMFRLNGESKDTFIVTSELGKVVGSKGQTAVKIVLTDDGFVISAYPVKVT